MRHHVRAAARIAPGRPAVWLGLRVAAATALPLVLAPSLGPVVGTWAPLAGFSVALVDRGGAYPRRAATMAGAALGALIAVTIGGLVSGTGALAVVVVTLAVAACAIAVAFGQPGVSVGNTTAVQLIVATSLPLGPGELGPRALGVVIGALWAMFLGLVVWPIRVDAPGRRAVSGLLTALAGHAAALGDVEADPAGWRDKLTGRHRALRDQLEAARATLAAARRGRVAATRRGERLLAIVAACDAAFGTLASLEEVLDAGVPAATRHEVATGAAALAAALAELAARVRVDDTEPVVVAWDLPAARERLAGLGGYERVVSEQALTMLGRALDEQRVVSELITAPLRQPPPHTRPIEVDPGPHAVDRARLALAADPALGRHALRVAVGVLAAMSLASGLHLAHGYWVTMTTFLLLQPHRAATTTKSVQRVVGTVIGAVVAAAIAWGVDDPRLVTAIVVVLAGASASVLQLNYALYAMLVTPTFVLLAEVHSGDFSLFYVRAANTLLGGAIALLAGTLLWRGHEHDQVGARIADGLDAGARYLEAVVGAALSETPLPSPDVVAARREFGLALNRAELALDHVLAERRPTVPVEPNMTLVTFTRRLGGAINAFGSTRAVVATRPHDEAIAAFAASVVARLGELATAVRAGVAPAPRPRVDPTIADPVLAARLARVELQLEVIAEAARRAAREA